MRGRGRGGGRGRGREREREGERGGGSAWVCIYKCAKLVLMYLLLN